MVGPVRRAGYVAPTPPLPRASLPSLELILDVLRSSRAERCEHFDALDQKAGLALGFAGVVVTLSHDVAQPWRDLGVGAAVIAAGLSLWAFWPREYDVLDNVRDYLAAPREQTQQVLVDTLALMNANADESMGRKAHRLELALLTLALAVLILGAGVVGNQ